ncbi:MAG: methyltransferase [Vicinamibacterales bacterium]
MTREPRTGWARLARLRVPLGFVCAALAFWLARPTATSLWIGLGLALPGELLRLWAAGHIDKGREITRSGPYRHLRHPLYVGSSIMAAGFVVAAGRLVVAALVLGYMAVTLTAAMRTEEATLDRKFAGGYTAYREGRADPVARRFSWSRVLANREYRAVAGFVIGAGILILRLM